MPDGAAIFETSGAWEDFSTPSWDLRPLIAIDVVQNFPDRVARRPEEMPKDKSVTDVKDELRNVLASELASRKIPYPRSDGSAWTLALKDVTDRATDRDEGSTCKRHASSAQRVKMTKYGAWFHGRRRPGASVESRCGVVTVRPNSRRGDD